MIGPAAEEHAATQVDEERQVVRHAGRGSVGVGVAIVFGGRRHLEDLVDHARGIDHAHLVTAGMCQAHVLAVCRSRYRPGHGPAEVDVVDQHGVQPLFRFQIDNGQGVRIHPAAFQLRGGHLVAGQDVCDVGIFAVGRDADVTQAGTAVDQSHVLDVFRRRIDQSHIRRHVVAIRRVEREVVDNDQRDSVRRHGRRNRFAGQRHRTDLFALFEIDERDIVVKAVAHVQCLTVGTDGGSDGGVSHGNRAGNFSGGHIDHGHHALGRRAGDVQLVAVGTQSQPGGLVWNGDSLGHLLSCDVEVQNLLRVFGRDQQGFAVRCGHHIARPEIIGGD